MPPKRAARQVRSRQLSPPGGKQAPEAAWHPRAKCLDTSALPALVRPTRAAPRHPAAGQPRLPQSSHSQLGLPSRTDLTSLATFLENFRDEPCRSRDMGSAGSACPSRSRCSQMRLEGAPLPTAVPFGLGPSLYVGPMPPQATLASLPPGHAWHATSRRRGGQGITASAVCARPNLSRELGAERQLRNCLVRAPVCTCEEGGQGEGRTPAPGPRGSDGPTKGHALSGWVPRSRVSQRGAHPTPLRRPTVLATKTPNR